MADDRIRMPSGQGGLVRYFDEYQSKIKFKPGQIVIMTIIIVVLLIILQIYGTSILGI